MELTTNIRTMDMIGSLSNTLLFLGMAVKRVMQFDQGGGENPQGQYQGYKNVDPLVY